MKRGYRITIRWNDDFNSRPYWGNVKNSFWTGWLWLQVNAERWGECDQKR